MITLTHVDGTRLYQAELSPDPGFLTYYVSDEEVPTKDLQPARTVDALWSDPTLRGYFLILKHEPADIQAFAAAVAEHGFSVPQHSGFAWVDYVQSPLKFSVVCQLDLKLDDSGNNVVIATDTAVRFGNYALPFMTNGVVQAIRTADGIQQFRFAYPLAYPPDRPPNVPADLPPAEGAGVNLPLFGAQRYALQSLALAGDFSNDSTQGLNVGLRYFYSLNGQVVSQFYPVFAASSDRVVEFQLNWDPLNALNGARTWMKFTGNAYAVTVTAAGEGKISVDALGAVLPSWLRTIYGKPLWLRPAVISDQPARLVMQRMPGSKSGEISYYMVPEGDFDVLPEARDTGVTAAQLQLLCGLAGTESLGFAPGTFVAPRTRIRFHPGKPAFAPVFPLTDSSSANGLQGAQRSAELASSPLLNDTWTTSWISVAPAPGVAGKTTYYAQPEQAAVYDPKRTGPSAYILELYQPPVAELTSLTQSYPLAVYSGVGNAEPGFAPENVRKFETQILNRSRKQRISEIAAGNPPPPPPPPAPITTTTPQGLVAVIDGMNWKSVLLAQNEGNRLEFINLPNQLRDALQSNQLFLVATLAQPLGQFLHDISIAGWPFNINVGEGSSGTDYRNVLIFKFGRGAMKDLVADPKAWTAANTFNQDPEHLSLFLQQYIASAETSAEKNYRFDKFVNLVSNPTWEGIIALRVTVGVNRFPDDLKGLLAGIDLERFAAHHFGIETSFVQADGGLKQNQSSLFGLISYVDHDYTTRENIRTVQSENRLIVHQQEAVQAIDPFTEFYDFKVLQLEVVFENSELLDFTSRILLTTTRWFGEPATLQSGYPPDPIDNQSIELDGSYEVHNGQPSYSFYTSLDQTYKFLIASNVLNYVQIVKARFETLRVDPQSDNSERIATRFSFWGYLNFKEQPEFDLFSFGSLANPQLSDRQGLYFSNLGIAMDFRLLANATTADRTFLFDAGRASYDISQSEVRPNSLVSRFPLRVTSILQSDGRGSPADLGYLSVRPPKGFKALKLSSEWYAINLDLNLGSMGALAEKAGFSAGLLLAWSPAESIVRAEVQIKLPGTGGGKKLLSLQGVLKLSIQYFEFTTTITDIGDVQYQLYFRNAGLSVFGKKLPTAGVIQMVLGGDPRRQLEAGSLSWLAAYSRKTENKSIEIT